MPAALLLLQPTPPLQAAAPLRCATRRRQRVVMPAAAAREGGKGPGLKVVGMGSCGVDYLASVAAFPRPDEKLRSEKLEVQGGGNAANALTAAARLGLKPTLVTKIGGDGLGDTIVGELQADGVDTAHVLRAPGSPSPFTYIIVDRTGGTRTCIHTPGEALQPEEMTPQLVADVLQGASLVYFDGRLAEGAVVLARAARAAGVPVLVEGERLRPGLDALLAEADFVVTSAHFPQDWTGEAELPDALLATARRLPRAKFIVTTMGKEGAVLLEPQAPGAGAGAPREGAASLQQVLGTLKPQQEAAGGAAWCTARSGLQIGGVPEPQSVGPVWLTMSHERDPHAVAAKAQDAAARAAALNADAGNAQGFAHAGASGGEGHGAAALLAKVTRVTIPHLPKDAVVDTTGAGDAFIGSVLYALATGLDRPSMLKLAVTVAACKCTAIGARQGLPAAAQLAPHLLQPSLVNA